MILVDSNIPMYLVGAPHPHKVDAQRLLEKLVSERQRLVTDAEVLQEILHRYVAIDRRGAIQPAFDALLGGRSPLMGPCRARKGDCPWTSVAVGTRCCTSGRHDGFPGVTAPCRRAQKCGSSRFDR